MGDSGNGQRPRRRNPAGRSCSAVIAAFVLVVAALAAVPAMAGTSRGTTAHKTASCTQYFDTWWDSNLLSYAGADWETTGCNYQIDVVGYYESRYGAKSSTTSGWVEALELDTQSSTPAGNYILYKAVARYEPDGGGSWRNCEQFYPSVGNQYAC